MDDEAEAYEKILAANLVRAFELLKFAEAKSAALLAFSSVWIVACFNLLAPDRTLPPGVKLAVSCALPLWGIAAMFGIWAFLPKTRRSSTFDGVAPSPPSLLFVSDIAGRSATQFREELKSRFYPSVGKIVTDDYLNDLIGQIYAVSVIADRKFRLFGQGASVALVALVVPGVPFALLLLRWLCRSAVG